MCVCVDNQLQPVIREDADVAPVTPHSSVSKWWRRNRETDADQSGGASVCTGEGRGESGREEPLAANVHKQHRAAAAAASTRSQERSR